MQQGQLVMTPRPKEQQQPHRLKLIPKLPLNTFLLRRH